MRTFNLLFSASLALAACAPESGTPEGEATQCALGGSADFVSECILESFGKGDFTIHHPDGSFRRFRHAADTGDLSAADGADELSVSEVSADGLTEFSVGSDRYRVNLETLASPAP